MKLIYNYNKDLKHKGLALGAFTEEGLGVIFLNSGAQGNRTSS